MSTTSPTLTLCSLFPAFTIEPAPGIQPTSAVTANTDQATPPTVTTTAQTVRATTQSQDTHTTAATTSLSAISTSLCLLKTAIANVSAGQTIVEGHILFHEGAQRSFITQELAEQLQLQSINYKHISVSSFCEQVSASKRLAVASISVETLKKANIPISVLIVPKLAVPIRNSVRTHLDKLPYLRGLPLAHPVTNDENFYISRADFYWQFIQDRIVRGDGPTGVESRLGYLLSGPLPSP